MIPLLVPLCCSVPIHPGGALAQAGGEYVDFRRGDANVDGCVDERDAELIQAVLFEGGEFRCEAAADANGDLIVSAADIAFILKFLDGGVPPPDPFPDCGRTDDKEISCKSYDACDVCMASAPTFIRGDANADGRLDIADAIFTLGFLFVGNAVPSCYDAVDSNDDTQLNIADAIFTLGYLFQGGSHLPPPHPNCGHDPSGDAFQDCEHPCG